MQDKIKWRLLTGLMLLTIATVCSSCKKGNPDLTPEEEAQNKVAQAELQATSKPVNIETLLDGKYHKHTGFTGKIVIRAKAKNNTNYSFKKPISLFIAIKSSGEVTTDSFGAPVGGFLRTMPSDSSLWKPGETVVLTVEEEVEANDNNGEVVKYLIQTLKLPADKSVNIDNYITAAYVF